ncbi:MAG: AsmA family protein [Acidobacteriales bacterium]|nr:AsmA family protein [Terriglobales bacterium]
MKKLGIALGVVLALLLIAALALPYLLDVNRYRDRIQAELQTRTGRAVSLGRMDLKIFPLAFRAENALIAEDPSFPGGRPFLQVPELLVSAQLWPLLQGEVQVNTVELRRPKIELIKNLQGQWNFASLGHAPSAVAMQPAPQAAPSTAPAAAPASPQPAAPPKPGQAFTLEQLTIVDGQVAVTDLATRQPRALYDHIDLSLTGYAPGKPVEFDLAAHLPGTGKETFRLTGKGGPLASDVLATDFDGQVTLDEVSFGGVQKFMNVAELANFDFVASGKSEIRNRAGVLSSKGALTLTNGKVRGVTIEYPIVADYALKVGGGRVEIEKGEIKLGPTPITVAGSIETSAQPARIAVRVKAASASISEMARLAGAFGVAFNAGMDINGRVDVDITAQGTTANPVYEGSFAARDLSATGKQLPQPVRIPSIQLALTPQEIRSNEFTAGSGSTSVTARFTLAGYASGSPVIDAALRAPNAQLGDLIGIGRTYGVTALESIRGSGAVSLDVRMQGPLKNTAALNYSGSGSLRNASLELQAFLRPVQVKNADISFSRNAVTLDNLAFTMGSSNAGGRVTLRGLAPGADPFTEFTLAVDRWDLNEFVSLLRPANSAPVKTSWFSLTPVAYAAEAPPESFTMRLRGKGDLQAGTLIVSQLQMSNAKSGATMEHGVLTLTPFTAQVYNGTQSGAISIDFQGDHTFYQVNTKLDKVDANQLLSSVSSIKQTLYGALAGNASAGFRGGPAAEMTRSINGDMALNLQNGKLVGLDMLNELAKIGKFFGAQVPDKKVTNLVKLTGDFKIKDGVAVTDNLNALLDTGTLTARGTVDLNSQALDLQMVAVLDKEFSQSVGGTQVGGYLTTALANSKGELVMPVTVTGSMSAPRVAPDYKAIAKMKLENLFPAGGKGGVLDAIFGKKDDKTQDTRPGGEKKSGGTLQNILDALGGKKTQPPAQQPPPAQPKTDDSIPDPTNPSKPKEKPPAKTEDKIPDPSGPK